MNEEMSIGVKKLCELHYTIQLDFHPRMHVALVKTTKTYILYLFQLFSCKIAIEMKEQSAKTLTLTNCIHRAIQHSKLFI